MSEVHRRVFPEVFKREAVAQVLSSGLPPLKVASELGLHETVLRRWMRQFFPATGTATVAQPVTPSVADLAAGNSRLRRKNDRLRMKREILSWILFESRLHSLDRKDVHSPRPAAARRHDDIIAAQ